MKNQKRVLIVDDEELNRELLVSMVESFGHEPVTASDGAAALSLLPGIDLVLLDAMMPVMDGFEVARRIRAQPNWFETPIIMVTALTSKADRLCAVEAGANDFITKPIDRIELKVRSASLLRLKDAQDAMKRKQSELEAKNETMQADMDLARAMQMAFLTKRLPAFPRQPAPHSNLLTFAYEYIPASQLGGDFFDVLRLSDTRAGIIICDVMGHGVRSALVTTMLRALVVETVSLTSDPGAFLTAINHHLIGILEEAGIPIFASAFYAVVDCEAATLHFANAGHPSPILIDHCEGSARWLLDAATQSGPALGLLEEASYLTCPAALRADNSLFLYTDGLLEAKANGAEWGDAGLLNTVQRHTHLAGQTLCTHILQETKNFTGGATFEDDVCMVAVEFAAAAARAIRKET